MKKRCWGLFFLILTVSCLDDPDCFQLENNKVGITFRVIGTGKADTVVLKGLGKDGKDLVTPFIIYDLNYFKEQADIIFPFEDRENNLSLAYNVKNQYVSEDCGSRFVLSDLKALDHDFDSVRISNSTPSPNGSANVDIYRCPFTDTLTLNFNQLSVTVNGSSISTKTSRNISYLFEDVSSDFAGKAFTGRATTLLLPIDLSKDMTTFTFKTAEQENNLVLSYNRKTENRYLPCGIQTFVSRLTIGSNTFDSISYGLDKLGEAQRNLVDPLNYLAPNIRVYNCPTMNLLRVAFLGSKNASKNVLVKGVTAAHITGNFLKEAATVSTLTLPVDIGANTSTFQIEHEGGTVTLTVEYTRTELTLFKACGPQTIISNLAAVNGSVIKTATSLQFPPVTNVSITIPD